MDENWVLYSHDGRVAAGGGALATLSNETFHELIHTCVCSAGFWVGRCLSGSQTHSSQLRQNLTTELRGPPTTCG